MTQPNDGGPAFPTQDGPLSNGKPGMSLRDWFATHAGQNDILRHKSMTEQANGITRTPSIEECKYAYADAMLKARSANV